MKKAGLFFAIIAVIAVGVTAWFMFKPVSIAVVNPVRGLAIEAVYATGTVEPTVMLPIAPRNAGRLSELFVDEGDQVEKGQILAQLEDTDLQRTLDELQAKADLAQKEYDRKKPLASSGAVSKEALDKAKADRDAAIASVERARVTLDYMKLTAPDEGRIIRREGEIGEFIPVNQPVFWISCCDGLRISTEVDEEDIALVREGQEVAIRADAFPGQVFDGTVQNITPKGDPVSRSYRVRVSLDPDTKLMIGMTAETNIIIRKKDDALLVPRSAVENGKILLMQEGTVKEQAVETGIESTEAIEIISGLNEGDQIVMNAQAEIEPGDHIKTVLKPWTP